MDTAVSIIEAVAGLVPAVFKGLGLLSSAS